jgi:dTDP-4-amino-4,6-dideoxygalactose transaminase
VLELRGHGQRYAGLVVRQAASVLAANDFAGQWDEIREDAQAAIDRVGSSGWLILGEELAAFERELAEWWGVGFAVGVASGLDAIEIALRVGGIGPGDRVLTTPLTAFATTLAIIRIGAEPVWCDVDDSGGLDLEQADRALTRDSTIRAMVPVHLYGHPLDPGALEHLASEHRVVVVEDCAQSVGASRDGRPTGCVGIASAVSLYPTKNLGAMGDGGVVLTGDEELAARARVLRDYGRTTPYHHEEMGLNSRLDELQAAILRSAHLPRLDRWLARRQVIADRYVHGLAGSVLRPILPAGGRSAHHLFPVEVTSGSTTGFAGRLEAAQISTGHHYPVLCSAQRALRGRGEIVGTLAVARRLAEREVSLPIHPYLSDEEIDRVIQTCLANAGE